eukprot:gene7891-16154_t
MFRKTFSLIRISNFPLTQKINYNSRLCSYSSNYNTESNPTSRKNNQGPKGLDQKKISGPEMTNFSKKNNVKDELSNEGVRLNKCITTLSRRAADQAIEEGRVTVNNQVATVGTRVKNRDDVRLDGVKQIWQTVIAAKKVKLEKNREERSLLYLKYWKPTGVTCTSDSRDKTNIISAGKFDLFPQRLFTVGRLDKDSTGLIILTSDGRVNNAMLSPSTRKEKVYEVEMDRVPTDEQLEQLRQGVVITTTIQRDSFSKPVTAKTLPCGVKRVGGSQSKRLCFTLTEGRNRQIRRMAEAVELNVMNLHRTSFSGITLKGLSEGNWMELNEKEIGIIQTAVEKMDATASGAQYDSENSHLITYGIQTFVIVSFLHHVYR